MSGDRLKACAELSVRVGANVGDGQYVLVMGLVEHAPLGCDHKAAAVRRRRELGDAVSAYDMHVRKARIGKGPEEMLDFSPPWMVSLFERLGERNGALISITGDPEPELLGDLDQGASARRGRSRWRRRTSGT